MTFIAWVFAAVFLVAPGAARAVDTLKWDDLAPPFDETRNPVLSMTLKQQDDVYAIIWGPNYGEPASKWDEEEKAAHESLKASGVDPEALFKKIESLRAELAANDQKLLPELNSRKIRIPGYVLPIDFDGKLVKSFLLVPSVGACIHVPPPPPNQIVFVKPDKPFTSEELYEPVWVTGEVNVGMDKKKLFLVDGSDEINFGYSMSSAKIEPYTEQ